MQKNYSELTRQRSVLARIKTDFIGNITLLNDDFLIEEEIFFPPYALSKADYYYNGKDYIPLKKTVFTDFASGAFNNHLMGFYVNEKAKKLFDTHCFKHSKSYPINNTLYDFDDYFGDNDVEMTKSVTVNVKYYWYQFIYQDLSKNIDFDKSEFIEFKRDDIGATLYEKRITLDKVSFTDWLLKYPQTRDGKCIEAKELYIRKSEDINLDVFFIPSIYIEDNFPLILSERFCNDIKEANLTNFGTRELPVFTI